MAALLGAAMFWTQAQAQFLDERTSVPARSTAKAETTATAQGGSMKDAQAQTQPLAAPAGEGGSASAQARPVAAVAVAAPIPTLALEAGLPVGQQLTRLARASGWTLLWNASQDWVVPAPAVFEGSFDEAASQIVSTLASNGADVRAEIYAGNKTIVVHAAGEHR